MSKSQSTPDDPRPQVHLNPDIIEVMRFAADMQRTSSRGLKAIWREHKLSERGLFILELVAAGLNRPGRLIEYFDVLPSTITFETDKLVTAGLLTRQHSETDRRVVMLALTDAGWALHRRTTETLNAWLGPRLAALEPGELATFLAIAGKILAPIPPVEASADSTEAAE